jgi:alpha-galactosidase/6-phospho-beta-glucosidase family protein
VQRSELATYVLTLKVNDIGLGSRRSMEGIVKFLSGDEEVYSRPIRLRDITSTADLRTQIFREVVFMEEWLAKQVR